MSSVGTSTDSLFSPLRGCVVSFAESQPAIPVREDDWVMAPAKGSGPTGLAGSDPPLPVEVVHHRARGPPHQYERGPERGLPVDTGERHVHSKRAREDREGEREGEDDRERLDHLVELVRHERRLDLPEACRDLAVRV